VVRGALETDSQRFWSSLALLAEIESLIPLLQEREEHQKRAREEKFTKKWRIIAGRQHKRCYGCGDQLPDNPIYRTDSYGNRTNVPPFIYPRKEVRDAIACWSCAGIMHGNTEEEFRSQLQFTIGE
jgi:hypothetical protein